MGASFLGWESPSCLLDGAGMRREGSEQTRPPSALRAQHSALALPTLPDPPLTRGAWCGHCTNLVLAEASWHQRPPLSVRVQHGDCRVRYRKNEFRVKGSFPPHCTLHPGLQPAELTVSRWVAHGNLLFTCSEGLLSPCTAWPADAHGPS